uniref:RNA helicase n=1 Tax=Amorphochlora amoebiformis TaxID=1561963 RepID=A0A7S0H9E7_9EUKA|mmetsp:Transcript_7950/g.12352  ORF Transcript_7950/g.12352 Transcript_7950/m.12352 type:complete len:471 (+) Transcript_7950:59-1471(+)
MRYKRRRKKKILSTITQPPPPLKEEKKAQDKDLVESKGKPAEENMEEKKETTWEELGLSESMLQAVKNMGWKKPSEIQRESLPFSLKGKDIIGLAETGSGKTGAFAIPIVEALLNSPQPYFALVLAPTRELAYQISEQFEALGAEIGLKTAVIVGGMDIIDQAIILAKRPHIIVATPGRIVDHLENTKGFSLRTLKFLCMDEADRLLNMDFEKELDKILDVIPTERRTFLFSATMTSKVKKLQRASLSDPVKIVVSHKYQTVSGLKQHYIFVPAKFKDVYTTYILNEMAGNSFMLFVATCEHSQRVAMMLRNLGFLAIPLHGKLSQPKRLASLNKFRSGEAEILVATDVASRGLDIPQVDVVINFDVPTHSKDYIHRVGRTARAGRSGIAITVVTQYDVELFQRIEDLIGQKLTKYPTDQEAVMILLERVTEAQRIAAMELRDSLSGGGKKQRGHRHQRQKQKGRHSGRR